MVSLAAALAGLGCGQPPVDVDTGDARPRVDSAVTDAPAGSDGPLDAWTPDARGDDNPHGITFTDVSESLGVSRAGGRVHPDPWGLGSGAAIADVDGDGDLDIFLARCDANPPLGGPSVLLRNIGGVGFPDFVEVGWAASAFAGRCAHGAAFGDYDRDGAPDLFVTLDGLDRLYHNAGDGQFVDVTQTAGVAGPDDDKNTGAYWADIDLDGFLDLLVLGHARTWPPTSDPGQANRLYRNRGDGVFLDISARTGVGGNGSSHAAVIADLDGDRDLELYIVNDGFAIDGEGGYEFLDADRWLDPVSWDPTGVPTYVDRSAELATDVLRSSMGAALADIDGDDRDDLFITDWGDNFLHIFEPMSGRYEDRAEELGVARGSTENGFRAISWDAVFIDLDRDSRQELIVINGSVYDIGNCESWSQRNAILRRPPDSQLFVDITGDTGWPGPRTCPPPAPIDDAMTGRGVIAADLDGDGDDDLLVTPYVEAYRLYRNDTTDTGRHQLRVQPKGTVSAPTPVGAVLRVTHLDGRTSRRTLYAGGTLTQRYPALEVGLGAADSVARATLSWPSGYQQRLDLVPDFTLDRTWLVVEPAWMTLSSRQAGPGEAPTLHYRPVDAAGAFIGAPAAGRVVSAIRSDGVAATVFDHGDGSYSVSLPHPGHTGITVLQLVEEGVVLGPRLSVYYR